MYQEIILIGNLGSDPEMKYVNDGIAVTKFSLATNKVWKDANGNKQEKVTWFRVNAWRGLAETTAQYLAKGSKVFVRGEVAVHAYTDKQGQPAASLEVTADVIRFLNTKGESVTASANGVQVAPPPVAEMDIPF